MFVNCITRTPIAWGEKVRLFFFCPDGFKHDHLVSENKYNIIGVPFCGKYNEHLNFNVDDNNVEYIYSLKNLIDKHEKLEYKNTIPYSKIEKVIEDSNMYILNNGKSVFVNTAVIKDSLYNKILKDENIKSSVFGNFEDFYKNKKNQLNELSILLNEDNQIDFLIKYTEFSRDIFQIISINKKDSFNIIKKHFESIIESVFVLKVLEEQGYLITPIQPHSEGNNKSDFLNKLLQIQNKKECLGKILSFKEENV